MPWVRAQRVSFSYVDGVPILADATFQLPAGWTGLVGANGAGKTTLLDLLRGRLAPSAGSLQREPADGRVIVCAQRVESLEPELEAFALDDEARSHRLRGRLRLDPAELGRWSTLSPGERKRWQVGAALAADPSVLLLDEPTNHLDEEARSLLVGTLKRFDGVGVVVSHDRTLLEALTGQTLRIDRGTARLWKGGYRSAQAQWEAELAAELAAFQAAKEAALRARAQLAEARREHASANASRSARHRMRGAHDSDARSMGAQNRADAAESRLGRGVGRARRAADASASKLAGIEMEKRVGRSVFVDDGRCPKPWLSVVDRQPVAAGGRRLLGPVSLSIGREDRVWIRGPNGAGKSTLLELLRSAARIPAKHILFLPQDQAEAEGREALKRIRALPPDERGRVLSLVAALGVEPARLTASATPSPGEARKLCLALGLGTHAWMVMLDEPTNHLDLPSIERLERALQDYPGALLVVTHDADFAERTTTTTWTLGDGGIGVSRRAALAPGSGPGAA